MILRVNGVEDDDQTKAKEAEVGREMDWRLAIAVDAPHPRGLQYPRRVRPLKGIGSDRYANTAANNGGSFSFNDRGYRSICRG